MTSPIFGSSRCTSSGSLVTTRWWRGRAQSTTEASMTSAVPASRRVGRHPRSEVVKGDDCGGTRPEEPAEVNFAPAVPPHLADHAGGHG